MKMDRVHTCFPGQDHERLRRMAKILENKKRQTYGVSTLIRDLTMPGLEQLEKEYGISDIKKNKI